MATPRSSFVRRGALVCAALACALVARAQQAPTATQIRAGQIVDRVAAVVGSEIILQSDVDGKALFVKYQFPSLSDSIARAQALQSIIDEKLLYAKGVEDSVQVSDDEVSQELDFQLQQFVQQYGSEHRVEEVYGKSIAQLKRDYRELVRKRKIGQRWLQQRIGEVPRVTKSDVEEFFRTYHDTLAAQTIQEQFDLSMIAVAVKPSTAAHDSAMRLATMIGDSLKLGASFADLAKRYSQDASSAALGGDLGFQKRGIFVKEFEQVAFALKEGATSGPVETQFGLHIIQLLERRGEEVHVRHILIKIPRTKGDDRTAIDSLLAVRAKILGGASFADMARAMSDDADTRSLGGALGPVLLSSLPSGVRDSLKSLAPGGISQPVPVQLAGGQAAFAIYRLERVIPAHKPDLATDYKQLERLTAQYLQQKEYDSVLADLRKQVYWEIFP